MTKYEGYSNFDPFRRYFQKKILEEAFYKAIYDLRHKATQTDFSTNCTPAQQKRFPGFDLTTHDSHLTILVEVFHKSYFSR